MQIKMSQANVQEIKPRNQRFKVRNIILQGLYLFVNPSGKKLSSDYDNVIG